MPTRMIRDGILTSERINALSERAELFYRRLMSVVDDHGRYPANPTLLRASCYPLKLDSVKEDSIKKYLAEAEDAGLIVLYTVAGKAYLEMQDFGQRVQSKSKYPGPEQDSRCSTVSHGGSRESTELYEDEDEDEVEDVNEDDIGPSPEKPAPAICIPLNTGVEFPITEGQVREFSGLYPAVDVQQSLREMRAWCIANPSRRKTRSGVLRFVNAWLSRAQDRGHGSSPNRASNGTVRKRRELE